MRPDEFNDVLREAVAELAARYHRIDWPEADPDPKTRALVAIAAGLLDAMPDGFGPKLLQYLGEAAVRDE
jgi:hypothetical protein